ncbi:hypothetical protein GQ53DRAFT_822538 [Thozetella sp. PMI_491]|nr:hypothetical protein GQ53DRAFT_822538 [Thozetella sp. PMI_491]
MIRLRRILSRIHRTLYANTTTRLLPLEQRQAIRNELLSELEEWRASTSRLQLAPRSDSEGVLSAFTDPAWYQAICHNAVLLLYRPSTAFPHQSQQHSEGGEDILRAMWHASRATISSYREVLRARKLNYSWICLYSIFIAGLSNVHSVGRCAQRRATDRNSFLPSVTDVVDDIRDCSNILTAICERWDDARSSCEIFSRLSNGAIKELLKAHSLQNSSSNTNHVVLAGGNPASRSSDQTDEAPAVEWGNSLGAMRNLGQVDHQFTGADQQPQDNMDEFQQLFQDVQTSLYEDGVDGSNEVFFGFDKDWFDQGQ